MNTLILKRLKNDKELRGAWKASIAMVYKDNWGWYAKKTGKKVTNAEDLHIIANNAAGHFLKLLCE